MIKNKKWNNEEISFLKENYKNLGAEHCFNNLNRTIMSIRKKAREIGVSYKKNNLKLDEKSFIEIVKNSNSITNILKKLNLRTGGGNFATIKKYINFLKLDTSHFTTKEEYAKRASQFTKKPIEYYLVEGKNCSWLKSRLYRENLKKPICEMCGQNEMWMGKKMSLILDHINGKHNDNRLENLRIVCPNCNATLETHCRGYKYIEQKNKKILKEISKIENIKKANELKRKVKRPTYENLKKDLEQLSYVKTALKYGVSDNSIRKWIKQYENKTI